jgi:hypothetical protein
MVYALQDWQSGRQILGRHASFLTLLADVPKFVDGVVAQTLGNSEEAKIIK